MRVYLPMTLPGLRAAHVAGEIPAPAGQPLPGHAVTAAIREWYVAGDLEELEFAALTEAGRACLELLAIDPDAPRQRVVVAADVPDSCVRATAGTARSAVAVTPPVPLSRVASVHVDEPEVVATIEAAVKALSAALAGDDDAQFLLDEAEACDLLWYDVTEVPDLI